MGISGAEQPSQVSELERPFLVFDNCADFVAVVDEAWGLVYANPSFRERFCHSGRSDHNFLRLLDAPSALRLQNLTQQMLQESRQVEINHITAEQRTAGLHYSFYPIQHAGKTLIVGIGRDRAADLAYLLEIINLNLELERKQKELSEANARLELLAITDQITELFNRHYFFQVAQHFWEEAKRYQLPLTLMMVDLDNFKQVNDTYGHLFGDRVLQEVAARLRNSTRKSDILARFGGEELVLLASNTDIGTGLVLAERLRLAIASEPFTMGNCQSNVTISVGVSGTELREFNTFEELLDAADKALYAAKRAGKNSVYSYHPGLASPA